MHEVSTQTAIYLAQYAGDGNMLFLGTTGACYVVLIAMVLVIIVIAILFDIGSDDY